MNIDESAKERGALVKIKSKGEIVTMNLKICFLLLRVLNQ